MNNQMDNQNCDFNSSDLMLKGFKVYKLNDDISKIPVYSRRDFYKICINTSQSRIHYADRGIETDGTILFFGNPIIPYSWETISQEYEGYACVFTEEFLKAKDRSETLHESPLFKIGGTPIFSLTPEQKVFIDSLFQKMIKEYETDYVFKDDLMRNYINLIIHESMKMQPSENFFRHKNASSRITSLFLELLERQFPIETKDQPLCLKTPQDYAQSLSVHVNHLNRSVKEVTGRPTTAHITDRIITEAKALLQHTDWSISDIGYSLGFEYPSYFNNYFKRLTGTVPKSLRM
ncbi:MULTISPECIES: helix-turn-helix transcriptional regulator [Flavobacterium]|uniref:Helix-turn-helix transcriptional regulator n=1 Tax=Flavobacterium endoglycinae TaxID=2816357 RepID=A0ABX7QGC2_9FLAO|nr:MULTISPECIES: helix-turn-helix transcriptional regulator [Flavobacterium]QSW89426.1 helix-turn-helix transcriptional regulator [Flavobacterium endoglycinae]